MDLSQLQSSSRASAEWKYPPASPHREGHVPVDSDPDHRLYWAEYGNPQGEPVLYLHGGPGGACTPAMARFFDPQRYRVILFDQRGCGRSEPNVAREGPAIALTRNTTDHLVADIEALRRALSITGKMHVFGGSWGSMLALVYAIRHPAQVATLVLRGIFTLRRSELNWYYNGGAGNLAPLWWESFEAPLRRHFGDLRPGFDRMAAYHGLLFDPDPAVHRPAGVAWTTWEAATSTLEFSQEMVDDFSEPGFARIENHYFVNGGWFIDGQLIAGVDAIRSIPAVIVQGRHDIPCPARTARDLHRAWPQADLRLVQAGHAATEPAIAAELVAATDAFAR